MMVASNGRLFKFQILDSGRGTTLMLDHFDLIAPFYDRLIGRPDLGLLTDLLKLPAAGRLLDAGGGTGRVAGRLEPLADQVVVSDLSRRMLKRALAKKIDSVCAHAERLPFDDRCFERIVVVDALHHFCDQQAALADLLRVLKPGGRLVIEEPDLNRKAVKALALAEKLLLMRSHFYAPEKIRDTIISHGCAATIEHADRYRAWIVADKK
jgi:demethylmenaquinone methyltransferase/2-methoxy-6-polyprenyl-1,4-benzoquinol methylase